MKNNINNIFNTIISTPFAVKKKNDGKMQSATVTMLEDNFKHLPKNSDLTADAVEALQALNRCYTYMEQSLTAKNEHQAEKAWNKAIEATETYLQAVGINATAPNIGAIMCIFSAKQQTKTDRTTKEKTVVGGYTTATTFKRCALYLTHHYITTGSWCDLKKSKNTVKAADVIKKFSAEELEELYIVQFGFNPEMAKALIKKQQISK